MGREQSASEIMINDYNDKVSERNLSLMINHYSGNKTKRDKRCYSPELATAKADYLCGKLKSPQSRRFYLKCAWNLTDMFIDNLLLISLKKEMPAKYFAACAAREMSL